MSDNPAPETKPGDELPKWARDKISELNDEAAKYRHEKKDAVEAARAEVAAEYQTKIEALEAQIAETNSGKAESDSVVARLTASIEAGIETDKIVSFSKLLQGDTPDELKSHAEEVKGLFAAGEQEPKKDPAVDPSQGIGSKKHIPLNGDPLLEAITRVVNK